MNLFPFVFAVVAAASFTSAGKIGHDKVQPFVQPAPVTTSEKAALKFKPSLEVLKGCHPYPAVNAAGETSGGLEGTGKPDGKCKGSGLGSQVYGRAGWYKDRWAIMYAWYFPKDQGFWSWIGGGRRHNWVHVILWIDNPELNNPKMLAVSLWDLDGVVTFASGAPGLDSCIAGSTPMISYQPYDFGEPSYHTLRMITNKGEFQDLIMWEQLTEEARRALTEANIGAVPFIDTLFKRNLEAALAKL
ncbi:hypothetical protein ON010_g7956 [Phytophthora cinnamomi]|nr:hypothetical protein ON010_g7956 [Phytophthora cinnamomi]